MNERLHRELNMLFKGRPTFTFETAEALLFTRVMDWNDKIADRSFTSCRYVHFRSNVTKANNENNDLLEIKASNTNTMNVDSNKSEVVDNLNKLESLNKFLNEVHNIDGSSVLTISDYYRLPISKGQKSTSNLNQMLRSYNIDIIHIAGDGDCLINSIISSLEVRKKYLDDEYLEYLKSIGIEFSKSRIFLVQEVRNLAIDLFERNVQDYELYFVDKDRADVLNMCQRYRMPGQYAGDFGDFMPKLLSNVFCLTLILLSKGVGITELTVTPDALKTNVPVFLLYDSFGPGHYDGTQITEFNRNQSAVHKVQDQRTEPGFTKKCRCGLGSKISERPNCRENSRCPCVKQSQGCFNCGCKKMCANPFGSKSIDIKVCIYNLLIHISIKFLHPSPMKNQKSPRGLDGESMSQNINK